MWDLRNTSKPLHNAKYGVTMTCLQFDGCRLVAGAKKNNNNSVIRTWDLGSLEMTRIFSIKNGGAPVCLQFDDSKLVKSLCPPSSSYKLRCPLLLLLLIFLLLLLPFNFAVSRLIQRLAFSHITQQSTMCVQVVGMWGGGVSTFQLVPEQTPGVDDDDDDEKEEEACHHHHHRREYYYDHLF